MTADQRKKMRHVHLFDCAYFTFPNAVQRTLFHTLKQARPDYGPASSCDSAANERGHHGRILWFSHLHTFGLYL